MDEFNEELLAECNVRRLTPGDREAFDLARGQQLTCVEIAEQLGETETEVRRRVIGAMAVCREE